MSRLARALLAQIDAARRAGDFDAVKQTLARSSTGITQGEFEVGEAALILRAAQEANETMLGAARRMELMDKAAKAAEMKRRADQARVPLTLDQIKRLDDRDWATQLLAAGNAQKGHLRSRARRS